jgi:hypothetical protein
MDVVVRVDSGASKEPGGTLRALFCCVPTDRLRAATNLAPALGVRLLPNGLPALSYGFFWAMAMPTGFRLGLFHICLALSTRASAPACSTCCPFSAVANDGSSVIPSTSL